MAGEESAEALPGGPLKRCLSRFGLSGDFYFCLSYDLLGYFLIFFVFSRTLSKSKLRTGPNDKSVCPPQLLRIADAHMHIQSHQWQREKRDRCTVYIHT